MNEMQSLLVDLGLSNEDSFELYHPRVRDSEDIQVLKCKETGAFVLSSMDQGSVNTYENKEGFDYWNQDWNKHKKVQNDNFPINEDDRRRAAHLEDVIVNKKWLDIGSGLGGSLRLLKDKCLSCYSIEPQKGPRDFLAKQGINCASNFSELNEKEFDIVTLFHVFEHLDNPLSTLEEIKSVSKPGAEVIIEVPQANDALIKLYGCEKFKDFTFWSEHLILHTRETLTRTLNKAGYKDIVIKGFQRYPLANHLYWLSNGKPGGHNKWKFLNNPSLNEAFEKTLQSVDMTDTLIAYAKA